MTSIGLGSGGADHPRSTPPGERSRSSSIRIAGSLKPGSTNAEQPTVISTGKPLPASVPSQLGGFEQASSLLGQRLGHFELQSLVGGGGMGMVYRGVDTLLGRTVAVKVLAYEHGAEEDTRARFQNEAQSAARLDHENIARVYFVGEDRGIHYIVYEFIDGPNIRELVERRGPLPLEEAISYTLQIARALAHAAERDVVHRDIKPSNILITASGQARLVDMGLARLHQVEHAGNDLTASGVTLGTFDYISPEQARDPRSADVRSDLYSLGCTLYYMLTGRPPFPNGTVLQKLLQHQGDIPADPRQFRPELPEAMTHVCAKMLAKSPQRRYQDPRSLCADLLATADQLGMEMPGVSSDAWVAPTTSPWRTLSRHVPWIAPVAVFAGLVLFLEFLESNAVDISPPWPTAAAAAGRDIKDQPAGDAKSPDSDRGVGKSSKDAAAAKQNGSSSDEDAGGNGRDRDASPTGNTPKNGDAADRRTKTVEPSNGKKPVGRKDVSAPGIEPMRGAGASSSSSELAPAESKSTLIESPRSSAKLTAVESLSDRESTGSRLSADGVAPASSATPEGVVDGNDSAEKIFVVGSAEGDFPTLAAACRAAADAGGDCTVELRFDGRRVESPIRLESGGSKIASLTIRAGKSAAGESFDPVVEFRPEAIDPDRNPRSMFTLSQGSLSVENVHWVMHLPEQPAERWTLFELVAARSLHLRQCTMTVSSSRRRSEHHDVAMLRVNGRGAATAVDAMASVELPRLTIALHDCIARGDATFLHVASLQPMRLTWDNGLLVSNRRFLDSHGTEDKAARVAYRVINLSHVTAITPGGFCRWTTSKDRPYELGTEITCSHCILVQSAGGRTGEAPLLTQIVSAAPGENVRKRIRFRGNDNFYQGYRSFWRVGPGADGRKIDDYDFNAWCLHWKNEPSRDLFPRHDEVLWESPPTGDTPPDVQTADDYALNQADDHPAVLSDGGRRDAGFDAGRLPTLPRMSVPPPPRTLPPEAP